MTVGSNGFLHWLQVSFVKTFFNGNPENCEDNIPCEWNFSNMLMQLWPFLKLRWNLSDGRAFIYLCVATSFFSAQELDHTEACYEY